MLELTAQITGLKYRPTLCRDLKTYTFENFEEAFGKDASFHLVVEDYKMAVSWWVSAKRTRSYPYARVYDTLNSPGKKVTIIPIFKDEGTDGDRDFLQWDTISLMSLLGIYVIIGYYIDAEKNPRYQNKITNQRHDINYIKKKILEIIDFQSDALHWNILQTQQIKEIGYNAIKAYDQISKKTGVKMKSRNSALDRIQSISKDSKEFLTLSRNKAKEAQHREGISTQPSERVDGTKAKITITNWLGGEYYFTSDETELKDNKIYLIEAKHTKRAGLPSISDIKDGLIKMDLFTNLQDIMVEGIKYKPVPVLKLTSENPIPLNKLPKAKKNLINNLIRESKSNQFKLNINGTYLESTIAEDL